MGDVSDTRDRREEVVRVTVLRRLTYQGPRRWVSGTLNRMLGGQTGGAVQIGPDRYVISEVLSRDPEAPVDVVPTTTLQEHLDGIRQQNTVEKELRTCRTSNSSSNTNRR